MKQFTSWYSLSIFLSAFLLFQVQPIIGKYILPWFGGTSGVWITTLLFFQILLLLGYLYSYLLSKFSVKIQAILHVAITISITSLIFFLFFIWQSPITPDIAWKMSGSISPIVQVLGFLFISVGLPYFVLSTTSTVLQNWFGIADEKKSPYVLYALSNAGSLLGIMSYPFLVEPFLAIYTQGRWWSMGFIAYGLLLIACCFHIYFSGKHKKNGDEQKKSSPVTKRTYGIWLLLAATSTIMLMAITSLLTQSVAPIPFLWLLPLGIYLVTFILCFSDGNWYKRNTFAYLFLISGPLSLVFTQSSSPSVITGLFVYSVALLSICMLCHGELYHLKPPANKLNIFYLYVALGGALGGIFVGIIAPLFFKGSWEIYIGYYISLMIAFIVLVKYKDSTIYRKMNVFFLSSKELYLFILIGFPLIIFMTAITLTLLQGYEKVTTWRNFYGILTVSTKKTSDGELKYLMHGRIIHGMQYSGKKSKEPISYYHPRSGVGLLMNYFPRTEKGLRVGMVGLGAGTLAAYGRKGDFYRFYDINPQVVAIAKTHFTYLRDTKATIDITLDDGRLALEKEVKRNEKKYDIVILDAFSDDAIPVHLLTKEAVTVYVNRLNAQGVMAFHISNNYIDLKHQLHKLAQEANLYYALLTVPGSQATPRTEWVLLTRNKDFMEIPAISIVRAKDNDTVYKDISVWTDTYSNLFQILK